MPLREEIEQKLLTGDYAAAEEMAIRLRQQENSGQAALELLTCIYIETGAKDKADEMVRELEVLAPEDAYTLFLQARVRFMHGERETLLGFLEAALRNGKKMKPAYQEKLCNLLGQCWRAAGDGRRSSQYYRMASQAAEVTALQAEEYSNYLFNLHYVSDQLISQHKKYQAHVRYDRFWSQIPHFWHARRQTGGKLRIGYISPDLRNHVVLRFSYAFFSAYDHEKFSVFAYACAGEDTYSEKVRQMVDGWRNLSGLEPAAAARCIYEDQIDILFDLSGHTANNCLPILAYRPAPVQISGIGYFATTGLKTIDYFLGDIYLDAAVDEQQSEALDEDSQKTVKITSGPDFTEKLLLMPHSHFCYTPLQPAPQPQAAPCVKNGYITLGSFNNFTKVNDDVLSVWQKILYRLPQARLLLKADIFNRESGCQNVWQRLQKLGFDLKRVELRKFTENYLEDYQELDIALDTWPYPGGGTTCDALYMGVPVVTMGGNTHGARFGCSILMNMGLTELCAGNAVQYVDIVVRLAGDSELLKLLHSNLRSMMQHSPLMDAEGYLQSLEEGYHQIWQRYCQQQPVLVYRDIPRYMLNLQDFVQQQDTLQSSALAGHIMAAGPQDRHILENLLGFYIDAKDIAMARQALAALQKHTEEYGYRIFLAARVAYLAGDWEQAIVQGNKALTYDMADWQMGLGHNLLAMLYKNIGEIESALEHYQQASRYTPDRDGKAADYSNYLFSLHYVKRNRAFMYEAACKYQDFFQDVVPYEHCRKNRHAKLRIGYISPDLRFHVVAFFSYVFFKNYDAVSFEVYAYAKCREDAASRDLAASVDHWCNISGMDTAAVAQRIYADEIDILVDLAGHTENNCLPVLAYRPAPVQVSGIGYFNTTGLQTVDYFLADYYTDPMGETANDGFFTEKLLRLSHSHFCYTWHDAPNSVWVMPCRKNGYITFGSFNNFSKVTDAMLAVWQCILAEVPNSHLLLKSSIFDHAYGKTCAAARLQRAGIPVERVEVYGHTAEYLQDYGKVDIALDTYPYPGGGTTCDALYMGVPVITLVGTRHNARFGYSLLMNMGLEECCAFSEADYIDKAVQMAGNIGHLATLHQTLRRRMAESPVMDAGSYMAEIEQLYRCIWQTWLQGDVSKAVVSADWRGKFALLAESLQKEHWEDVLHHANAFLTLADIPAKVLSATGAAYLKLADYGRAVFWLCRALMADTENTAYLYLLLGQALRGRLDHVGALRAFTAAAENFAQKPAEFQLEVLVARAHTALILGKPEAAAGDYWSAMQQAESLGDRCMACSSYLLSLHYRAMDDESLYAKHAVYGKLLAGIHPCQPVVISADRRRKLRVGYISPDFRQHVMFAFYYVFFAGYNHSKFEVFAYQRNAETDGFTKQLRSMADHWRDISGCPYEEAAKNIYADQLDILVDLAGHSAAGGLPVMAWKPATIQISGLGYMSTTGLSAVDYFITDDILDPPGQPDYLLETPLRLQSQFCYVGRNDVPESTGAPCRQAGYIQFGVFNHYVKITDDMLLAWKDIMEQVPGSRLLLKSQVMVSDSAVDLAYERLSGLGFAMDRVIFEAATNTYMERYLSVDIALDTYPYPGGGTTADALYMGVPVVSLYSSQRRGSRFGRSILQNIGLGELAVSSIEQYVAVAVALASDWELLDQLHRTLRQQMTHSAFMDVRNYMEQWEAKLQEIWQKQQK